MQQPTDMIKDALQRNDLDHLRNTLNTGVPINEAIFVQLLLYSGPLFDSNKTELLAYLKRYTGNLRILTAIINDDSNACRFALQQPLQMPSMENNTLLHVAAASGHGTVRSRVCDLILQHNPNSITAKNDAGHTPIHIALFNQRFRNFGYLLQHYPGSAADFLPDVLQCNHRDALFQLLQCCPLFISSNGEFCADEHSVYTAAKPLQLDLQVNCRYYLDQALACIILKRPNTQRDNYCRRAYIEDPDMVASTFAQLAQLQNVNAHKEQLKQCIKRILLDNGHPITKSAPKQPANAVAGAGATTIPQRQRGDSDSPELKRTKTSQPKDTASPPKTTIPPLGQNPQHSAPYSLEQFSNDTRLALINSTTPMEDVLIRKWVQLIEFCTDCLQGNEQYNLTLNPQTRTIVSLQFGEAYLANFIRCYHELAQHPSTSEEGVRWELIHSGINHRG